MNNKHYTSIEQSKKLLSLGMSPESADMYWAYTDKQNYVGLGNPPCDVTFGSPDEKAEIIPCWSVGALLEVMPPVIKGDRLDGFSLCCWKTSLSYIVQYEKTTGNIYEKEIDFSGDSPIEAYYKMVVWLLENNYIKSN